MNSVNSTHFKKILSRNILLPIGMCTLILAVLLSVVSLLWSVNRDVAEQNLLIEKESEALKLILDTETKLRGYLLMYDDKRLQRYEEARSRVQPALDELSALVSSAPVQAARVNDVAGLFSRWSSMADRAFERAEQAGGTFRGVGEVEARAAVMDEIRQIFENMQQQSQSRRLVLVERASQVASISVWATVLITVVLSSILALAGRRQLMSLSASYEESLTAQARQTEELTLQTWVRTAQAELAEKMKGEAGISSLGGRILNYLCEYTGAAVGAFYIAEESGALQRAAQYAFSESSGQSRFLPREGLVGQVADSKRPMVLSDLPEEHMRVASGTLETRPRHLVLIPLLADGVVQGVVELAYLRPPEKKVEQLLEESGELMGSAVRARAYQDRLQVLLNESQLLTEKLQTQQEELRVSNEELEERTKILQEAQARLESQHAELEQTNEQLEEQATLLEEQKRILDNQNRALLDTKSDLEEKTRELEAASRYKSEFLANMSHELRTPLNSSLILAKLLKDNPKGNLTPEQVEFAQTIYSAGNDLLLLINDILDLAKVESGKLELVSDKVPVKALLASLERSFRPLAAEKGLEFLLRAEDGAPGFFVSDRQRVEQVLRNLLSNALKFTQRGRVELVAAKNDMGGISFHVKDTGIGIDPSQQETIFEAFRQADGTTSRKYGGTGLGLSISRTLAGLLGGSLGLESSPGKGSTFTLRLPAEMPVEESTAGRSPGPEPRAASPVLLSERRQAQEKNPHPPLPAKARAPVSDDRETVKKGDDKLMLMIEDEPRYAKILVDVAHDAGFRCLVASSNEEGYELAKSYSPKAILLDIRLPDGSGLGLLDRLKRDPATRHIPVHGMSVADYSREALHLGAAGFEQKPTDAEAIKQTLYKIEEKAKSKTKRVLLVEDDPVQRSSVEKLIGAKGVKLESVESGGEALKRLKEKAFDCMIIDLKLPDMSGFDLLEQMSVEAGSTYPPVIVYTGRQLSHSDEERLYRYSRSIIIKGARSPERLLDEVTLFLHQSESELSAESRRLLNSSRNRDRAFEGRKILVVDDDVRNVFALTNAIELKGAVSEIARNGREAVEKVEKMPEIDLVLMDIMMPEMDGLEAIRRIRASKAHSDIPIIAITAKAMQDDYEKCLEAGADDYLAKPVNLDRLMSLIRVWLPKHLVLA